MTDEEAFQIIRKHILSYDPSKARYPYGWMSAVIDAQKEIISEAVEKGSIEYAKYVVKKMFFDEPEDTGEIDWVEAKKSYQEYLKSQTK